MGFQKLMLIGTVLTEQREKGHVILCITVTFTNIFKCVRKEKLDKNQSRGVDGHQLGLCEICEHFHSIIYPLVSCGFHKQWFPCH